MTLMVSWFAFTQIKPQATENGGKGTVNRPVNRLRHPDEGGNRDIISVRKINTRSLWEQRDCQYTKKISMATTKHFCSRKTVSWRYKSHEGCFLHATQLSLQNSLFFRVGRPLERARIEEIENETGAPENPRFQRFCSSPVRALCDSLSWISGLPF